MNHGFQALLEMAESVIPDTCRSRLLKACLKYGFTGLFLVSRSQLVCLDVSYEYSLAHDNPDGALRRLLPERRF
jgi:hypothetical protein